MRRAPYTCDCGGTMEFVRVDFAPKLLHGAIDGRNGERGLAAWRCDNAECEHHAVSPDQASMSPGRQLVAHVKGYMRCGGRRWTVNCDDHVSVALRLAIRANLEFFLWDADFIGFDDGDYAAACMPDRGNSPNVDAARAMEAQSGQPPFILEGKRLAVGGKFWWRAAGGAVEVSSIRDREVDGQFECYLVCLARDEEAGKRRQFKVTAQDLRAAEKAGNATWETHEPEQVIAERMARRDRRPEAAGGEE